MEPELRTTPPDLDTEAVPRRRPTLGVVLTVAVISVTALALGLWLTLRSGETEGDPPSPPDSRSTPTPAGKLVVERIDPAQDTEDQAHRRAIIGRWWRDDYYGRAFLDIKEGGTGTMTIKFGSWYYYAIGPRVDAEIAWVIENGRAIFDSIRGEPEEAYRTVIENKGKRRDRKVIEITDEGMVLLDDLDDGSKAVWQRMEAEQLPPEKAAQ